jgi:putative nucleotidyltransferase with HDIG domain
MNRDEALELLRKYIKNENLVKHCLATGAIMRGLAEKLGKNAEKWELAGLLHDIDYEVVGGDMQKHGLTGSEILKKAGIDEEITEAVKKHNYSIFEPEKPIEIALQAADNVSGLIIACALVKGKKLSKVTPESVKKKFKEKSFAAGCNRDRIRLVENLGIDLQEFYAIAIESLLKIKDELGLN